LHERAISPTIALLRTQYSIREKRVVRTVKVNTHPVTRRAYRFLAAMAVAGTLSPTIATAVPARASLAPLPNTTQALVNGQWTTLQPPAVALHPHGAPSTAGPHGLGLDMTTNQTGAPGARTMARASVSAAVAAALPAAVDLSQYNPPVGNQGSVNSCAAWATGYYLRGWYAKRDGYYPTGGPNGMGSFAPMYTYAQIVKGANSGTSLSDNLQIQLSQGIDTRADYTQGDYDNTTQPTSAETNNASGYKIAGTKSVFEWWSSSGSAIQQAIEASLAGGDPIVITMPVYDNFYTANANVNPTTNAPNYYIDGAVGSYHGSHAVFATKYDSNGLWIENQWGTGWGLNGWAELSWNFVTTYASEGAGIIPVTPSVTSAVTTALSTATATQMPPTATSTTIPSTPTSTNAPTATATSVPPTATSTNTPVPPTATHTAAPIPTNTSTAIHTATAVPSNTATNTAVPPTSTGTSTSRPTATATNTTPPTATATNTTPPTRTATPIPPTSTATDTATHTATATLTPTHVSTAAATAVPPTSTATDTATSTATPPRQHGDKHAGAYPGGDRDPRSATRNGDEYTAGYPITGKQAQRLSTALDLYRIGRRDDAGDPGDDWDGL